MLHLLHSDTLGRELDSKQLTAISATFCRCFPTLNQADFLIDLTRKGLIGMRNLNLQFRNLEEPTDVLSFPTFQSLDQATIDQSPSHLLGSIVICPQYAKQQGTALAELVVHGILHLLGYDHDTDKTTWLEVEHAIITEAKAHGLALTGIAKGYL